MGIEERTIAAAQKFGEEMDEEALLVLLGRQEKATAEDLSLAADPTLEPEYESELMGVIDELKSIGKRIMKRWNKELYKLICSAKDDDQQKALLDALSIGEAAAIAAVASLLLAIAPAAVAAAAAPLIVKRFLMPAKEELCTAWGELMEMDA